MSPRAKLLLGLSALLPVTAAGGAWWLRTPIVPALEVQPAPLVRTLLFSARVATASRVELGSTLTGRVEAVRVDEGARVRRGQVLVELESDELRAALVQARASERQAAARLAGLRSTGRTAARSGVAQAESVLQAAQADLQRTRELVASGFLSEARLDEVRRAVAVAEAQLDAARAQRAANDERGTDVAQAEAQLALARAATVAAQARLAQAVLTAPADGRVLLRAVEPGQIVQPGRALLTLALQTPVELVGAVDERYIGQLQPGQRATVVADAYPAQRLPARVQSIAPLVDPQRGSVEVKLALVDRDEASPPDAPAAAGSAPGPAASSPAAAKPSASDTVPPFLREDMTLSVEVQTGHRERALAVPLQALVGERVDDAGSVNLARDGRVERRRLRLGLRTLEAAEVVDGLAAGDVVLLGPAPEPGRRVRADLRAPEASAPAGRPRESAGAALGNAIGR